MPRYSDLLPYQPLPGRGGRLSDLSRQELEAYVDQVAPDAALRFGNMARADYPYSMDGQGMRQALEDELRRMDEGMEGQTLDQAAVATAGVPILGDAVGLAADAKAVYDDPSWMNIGGAALGALPFVPAMAAIRAYHGGSGDVKIAAADKGAWFSDSMDLAKEYAGATGRVTSANIDPQKTIQFRHAEQRRTIGDIISEALENAGEVPDGDIAKAQQIANALYEKYGDSKRALFEYWNNDSDVARLFRSLGYDSISVAEKPGMKVNTWGILDPEKIAAAGIRAYHGSPHDFDKFDMSKIGTGEGAQAYGHGLYFAEAEDVAKEYRDNLAYQRRPKSISASAPGPDGTVRVSGTDRRGVSADYGTFDPNEGDVFEQAMAQFGPGRMYEVNINADPEDFLDWDRPLREQPQKVREFLAKRDPDMYMPDADDYDAAEPGSISYERLAKTRTPRETGKLRLGDSGATSALREAGIPGIRYLDQNSRAAGEGTRNYVVFDDKLIDIIRKYGIGALLGGTGAFGLMSLQGEDGTEPPL